MRANPFVYGKEVSGENFYDRKEDFGMLVSTLAGGSANVVLYAPRRYGKTSLAKKALEELSRRGFRCIHFDLMRVESLPKFCEAYASSVYALEGGAARAMRRIGAALSSLRPKFTLGNDGKPALELDLAVQPSAGTVEEALDLPERLAHARHPVVVAFDEFQEIASLSPTLPLEGVFRSCIQRHKHVRYLFLGSKTHMMERMFADRSRPFYNSAAIQRLGLPPAGESAAFVASRFASAGMRAGDDAVQRILALSGGIPYYIQALSALAFDAAAARGRADISVSDIDAAAERLIQSKSDFYETALQSLSTAQRTLLAALSGGPVHRFDTKFRTAHGLGPSSAVHSALAVLREKGFVESTSRGHEIGDPLFARYLAAPTFQLFPE
ncbi:MAG: ATP-binding protein [Kiritimatiellae bacterium]|nr:ATP-binding protein [Kiritimatiellia bacterium]MBR4191033.1 ATP-binding protein [Kiritimatiellia bacterium]